MAIEIKVVSSKSDLKEFIFLPEIVHACHENWVPPLYSDEWKFYDTKYNPQLIHAKTIKLLAYKESKLSGRIMGIIHQQYNEIHNELTARFYNIECFNDIEVAHALISRVEKWAKDNGMNKMVGPFGFSDKDPQGIQVEGFENLAVIATATNLPYMQELIEQDGYIKERDCVVYKLVVPKVVPEFYHKIYNRVSKNTNYKLVEFKSRKELKPFILPVLRLVNETYQNIYGFILMDENEMKSLADKYIPILDPLFTKVILNKENQPIAFVVASPDISMGIRKAKGKLFPFGFIKILLSAKRTKQLDLFLGAVQEKYHGYGITTILGIKIFEAALKRGLEYIDSHLILETNKPMRSIMERLGGTVYKRYRIYQKKI